MYNIYTCIYIYVYHFYVFNSLIFVHTFFVLYIFYYAYFHNFYICFDNHRICFLRNFPVRLSARLDRFGSKVHINIVLLIIFSCI